MTVSAIIVNYRTARLVEQLVVHLQAFAEISAIVVVDNSGEMDREPGTGGPASVSVIQSRENVGFGRGVNAGLGHVDTEWVLVVNPDVRPEKSCLRRLMDAAEKFDAVLAGPRFYWDEQHRFRLPPATGDFLGMHAAMCAASRFTLDAKMVSFCWQIRHERFWSAREPFFEPFLSGACLLVHVPWIRKKGGLLFDERFFLYYEDTDLCVRAMQDGQHMLCVPGAAAVHYYNQSPAPPGEKAAAMEVSAKQFYEKHYPGQSPAVLAGEAGKWTIEDHGKHVAPPVVHVETGGCDRALLEIAMNPLFVPFVQCEVGAGRFRFPQTTWDRLAPGRYYSRIRNPYTNRERTWQWEKVNP